VCAKEVLAVAAEEEDERGEKRIEIPFFPSSQGKGER